MRSRSYLLSQLSQPVGLTEAKGPAEGDGEETATGNQQKATGHVRNTREERAKCVTASQSTNMNNPGRLRQRYAASLAPTNSTDAPQCPVVRVEACRGCTESEVVTRGLGPASAA